MPGTSVIGLQWGDEAKGKIVDLLTRDHDIVVRYQGGANAGHTVVADGEKYKLSLLPSGALSPHVKCVIAGGMVVYPAQLIQELDGLNSRGIQGADNLMISDRAHVIFPWHFAEEQGEAMQTAEGENIGTTQRGIGPCYQDKVGRSLAIRLGDLYRDSLQSRIEHIVQVKERQLASVNGRPQTPPLDAQQIFLEYSGYARRLAPYVGDTTEYLLDAAEADQRILFEGAQGSLLDVDHGTYPFVTSSNSSGAGVACGSGVPARYVDRCVGVVKAYSTRVGGGPFPTEQDNEIGQHIRDCGDEYGTVTRRPRRCGWFDAVAAKYTARLSGIDAFCVMLLDVLSELPELKLCTAYELDGQKITRFPSHVEDLRRVDPVYETLPGWQQTITGVREFDDLPAPAQGYVRRLRELLDRPVEIISVGPDREQTMFVRFQLGTEV